VNNQLDHIKEVVATVCEVDVDPDGIAFNRTSIEVSRIKEDADYEGVRVQFHATLARARIPIVWRQLLFPVDDNYFSRRRQLQTC